jgi:hypothetical protein
MAATKKTPSKPPPPPVPPRPGTRSQSDAKATNVHGIPSAYVLVDAHGSDIGGDLLWLVEKTPGKTKAKPKTKTIERHLSDATDAIAADGTGVPNARVEFVDLWDGRTFTLVDVRAGQGSAPVIVFEDKPSDEMLGTGVLPEVGFTYVTMKTQPKQPTGDADDADLHPYAIWYFDDAVPEPEPDTESDAADVDP